MSHRGPAQALMGKEKMRAVFDTALRRNNNSPAYLGSTS